MSETWTNFRKGQFTESLVSSHTVIWLPFTVVLLMKSHEVTQLELDLYMKLGEAQAEQMKAAGEPRLVVWIPNGRAQEELHWLMEPFRM